VDTGDEANAKAVVETPPIPQPSSGSQGGASDRLRQQELLSALGVTALRGAPLEELLNEAVRVCADGLGAELCKVREYQPQESRLLMRAGFGWQEGLVGLQRLALTWRLPRGTPFQTIGKMRSCCSSTECAAPSM
jgi:hypothetical protein